MIRVTIELVPHGLESGAQLLSTLEIANVGGDHDIGQYRYRLFNLHDKPIPDTELLGGTVREWTNGSLPSYPLVATGGVIKHTRSLPIEYLVEDVLRAINDG